jgi:hypothetical protein
MKIALKLLVTLYTLNCLTTQADENCQGQTLLEVSYCSLVARGASGLPPLYEFRKNTPDTQYLLLKRPAAKYAVVLPVPTRKAKPAAIKPIEPALANPTTPPSSTKIPASTHSRSAIPVPVKVSSNQSIAGCRLANEIISCGNQRFALQWNKPKNALKPEALGPGNQLIFPPEPKNPAAQNDYLLDCFVLYVQKMLVLGLGNTTLTFDKFAAIYAAAKTERFDFAGRFERMYHFLKEERKTLQPPKGFGHQIPTQLDECQPIDDTLWSCQTAEQHWIFAKT